MNSRINAVMHSTDRRNYFFGVLNGAFTQLGMNLTQPGLVLSVLIRELGGSNALVGSLSAIRFAGWYLPQFLAASWIQPLRRKVPVAVGLETIRVAIYAVLGFLAYSLSLSNPALLLFLLFSLFTISRLSAGMGALARTDAIGKIILPSQRASFFAARSFFGGLFVFGAGFLVSYVLDETHGQPFPFNFALLFGLSTLSFILALLLFSRVKEQPGAANQPRRSLKAQLGSAPVLLKGDPTFRRYVLVRIMLYMTQLAAPFYPIFALDVLGAPVSMVGFYMSAQTLARILSNLLWQRLGRTRGNFYLVKVAALLTLTGPLLAAAMPWLMQLTGLSVERTGLLPAYLFSAVFIIAGSSQSGRSIGFMSLLLDIAPDAERASYIGFVNTTLGLISFSPILAGTLIDRIGFRPIFFTSTGLLVLGYLLALRWKTD